MLDRLFGRGKKKEELQDPGIRFGRYSDNNKPLARISRWTDADNLFKEKKYNESFDAFFDYVRDDVEQNMIYERSGDQGKFEFYQGSRVVRGTFGGGQLSAEVTLARMPQPSVPVMRRLLEMNLNLYYSRCALDKDRLCIRFDSVFETANPSRLYYGLKELATRADKQDDLLLQDFSILETTDTGPISPVSDAEKEIKYGFLQSSVTAVLDTIAGIDPEKFSGGVSYMLLALVYRLDYLLSPDGKLLSDLENIAALYFRKDERPATEKNNTMIGAFRQILARPKEEALRYFFRARYTFSIVSPQPYKAVTDSVAAANQNCTWYVDNNYPQFAQAICEYGVSYCQYSYSMPRPVTEFYHLFMMINYPEYFSALGYGAGYFDRQKNQFDQRAIIEKITAVTNEWKAKYPQMLFNAAQLRFDNLTLFNLSFTAEIANLNLDVK